MKTLPLVLLLALVGCSRSENNLKLLQTSEKVSQWVPMGTSLAVARQTMEQHQFACTVSSYDSREQMQKEWPKDTAIWNERIIKDRVIQDVKNVTYLQCKQGNLAVLLQLINGETRGIFSSEL